MKEKATQPRLDTNRLKWVKRHGNKCQHAARLQEQQVVRFHYSSGEHAPSFYLIPVASYVPSQQSDEPMSQKYYNDELYSGLGV